MKTQRFTLRAICAAAMVVAIIAVLIPRNVMPSGWVPSIIWGVAISVGLVYSGGRGQACLVFSTIAGVVGSAAAALFISFSSVMAFGSWAGPVCVIVLGGIGGCVVGILVRLVMEGLVISQAEATSEHRE